jgi:hypothetical protein
MAILENKTNVALQTLVHLACSGRTGDINLGLGTIISNQWMSAVFSHTRRMQKYTCTLLHTFGISWSTSKKRLNAE